jgi:hypothetical protein
MIASIDRPTMVASTMLGTAIVGGISGETLQTIAILVSFTGAVVTGFAWLDARFDRKIKAHAAEEEKLHKVRNALLLEQIKTMVNDKVDNKLRLAASGD